MKHMKKTQCVVVGMINVVYESCGYFKAKSLGINRLIDVRGLLRDLTHVVYLVEDSAGMLESLGFRGS